MKYNYIILVITVAIICVNCSNIQKEYPSEIIEKNLQKQYDITKFTLYMLWERNFSKSKEKLTLTRPICKSIQYFRSDEEGDTTTISFFFDDDYRDKINSIGLNFSAVGFVNKELAPAIIYANDGLIIEAKSINSAIKRDNYEAIFVKEILECECTNKWLKNYIDEKHPTVTTQN